MGMKLYKFLFRIIKNWSFNNEEKEIILKKRLETSYKSDKIILIQCPKDLYWFEKIEEIAVFYKNYNIKGVVPQIRYKKVKQIIFYWIELLHKLNELFLRRKWEKIYSSLGIIDYYGPRFFDKKKALKNFLLAYKFFKKIKSKEELLNHNFNGIKCGDLIYDSYMRYNNKPTIDINDFNLIFYITDCYNHINYYTNLARNETLIAYYSTYSTYISHGIPVRVFSKFGIKTFTFGYFKVKNFHLKLKKLTSEDTIQTKPYWNFKNIFDSLKEKEKEKYAALGYKEFGKRFKGSNDLSYMKSNQYSNRYVSPPLKFQLDGVVFIGDFFDSQHIYRSMVFNDLYEWLIYTIDLVVKHNLNVGFKPHPNQLEKSRKIINKLKNNYSKVIWIDPHVSNNVIFKSGIKYGISVYGSVLQELAYNKISPISCGDNPTSSFDFVFEATTKSEYKKLILNPYNLLQPEDVEKQIGAFYYMYHIYDKFQSNLEFQLTN